MGYTIDMKKILEKNEILKPPKVGEIVEGRIIGIGRSSVYIDLGGIGTGIIYGKEFQGAKENLKKMKPGEKIFAKIVDLENEAGYIELSLSEADREISWKVLSQKKEEGEILTVKILKANKGGLMTEILGIPAFLPVSQLSFKNYPRVQEGDKTKILRALQKFVGKELKVKIINVLPQKEALVLSEKAVALSEIKEGLKNCKVGDIVKGEITGIVDFGAFLKFSLPSQKAKNKSEPIEGLIHISELDWQLVDDPSKIVKVGEKLKAKIIEISDDRVSLSLKALKQDPWQDIEKKYKKGDEVSGEVVKFNPFGAFVKISPKIQGLCHISEFGTKRKMEKTLEIGKKYNFKILSIEPENHKMTLKLINI